MEAGLIAGVPAGVLAVVAGGLAVGVLFILLWLSVRRIPQGFEFTLERFGRYRRLLRPGLHWVLPLVDRIGVRQDMRERHLVLTASEIVTSDRVPLRVNATVFWQVQDAARASYEVANLEASLHALLTVSLRTLIGERDCEELLTNRSVMNTELLSAMDDAANVWGVRLTRTEIGELTPPAALLEAFEQSRIVTLRIRGERAAAEEAARNKRLAADTERRVLRASAEARAEATRLEAEAEDRVAEGDARAALMLSRAVQEGDAQALNYLLARRYVDAMKTLAESGNGRFVVLPLESGGITATLSDILKLAGEASAQFKSGAKDLKNRASGGRPGRASAPAAPAAPATPTAPVTGGSKR